MLVSPHCSLEATQICVNSCAGQYGQPGGGAPGQYGQPGGGFGGQGGFDQNVIRTKLGTTIQTNRLQVRSGTSKICSAPAAQQSYGVVLKLAVLNAAPSECLSHGYGWLCI